MKKLFVEIVIFLALVILTALPIAYASEGTKVLENPGLAISATVPETAPDFIGWPGMIVGSEKYSNGNVLAMVAFQSEDEQVNVTALVLVKGDKYSVLAFAVFYERKPNERPDVYEDLGFIKDGKPTGKLERVKYEAAHGVDVFKNWVNRVEV